MPSWVSAVMLNLVFLALYMTAYMFYEAKPNNMVSAITTAAILLALVLAAVVLIFEIARAQIGEVAKAVSRGVNTSLNLAWATTAVSFLTYIGWNPVSEFVLDNLTTVTIATAAGAIVMIGYAVAKPSTEKDQISSSGVPGSHALTVHPDFKQTPDQRPAFQATIADLTRLIAHQAGRAIGYAGSNILFDDAFSLELDVNARVGRVYSNTNLIQTEEFMYWRLHMLMMGPAAERVLTGRSSEVAVDDFTSFDDLAGRYLMLRNDRTFNAAPINQHEAAIKASRITFLRKSIFDRCLAACTENKVLLVELVKLMRTRSVLTYGDIRSQLERVQMPEGFPVAKIDNEEILHRALLEYEDHEEVTLEGSFTNETKTSFQETASEPEDGTVSHVAANDPHSEPEQHQANNSNDRTETLTA